MIGTSFYSFICYLFLGVKKYLSSHDRKIEYFKKFWESYGAKTLPQKDERGKTEKYSFKPDFIVDLSWLGVLIESLDCNYIWGEVVVKGPPTSEKMEWLPQMLSHEWLILIYGYGEGFRPIRPKTYKGKMTFEETKKALQELIQQRVQLNQHSKTR